MKWGMVVRCFCVFGGQLGNEYRFLEDCIILVNYYIKNIQIVYVQVNRKQDQYFIVFKVQGLVELYEDEGFNIQIFGFSLENFNLLDSGGGLGI